MAKYALITLSSALFLFLLKPDPSKNKGSFNPTFCKYDDTVVVATEKQITKTRQATTIFGRFEADIKEGTIGTSETSPVDVPFDNVFHVHLPASIGADQEAYLSFEIKGIQRSASLTRCINGKPALGSFAIGTFREWQKQEEPIPAMALRKGDNVIRFTLPQNASSFYRIRNVAITVGKEKSSNQTILAQAIMDDSGRIYVRGMIRHGVHKDSKTDVQLSCADQTILIEGDEFETVLPVAAATNGTIRLQAVYSGTKVVSSTYRLKRLPEGQALPAVQEKGGKEQGLFTPSKRQFLLTTASGAGLLMPVWAHSNSLVVSVVSLRDIDMPNLPADLVNVTAGAAGYRFLPQGLQLAKPAKVILPFDSTLIPEGYTRADVRAFYFEEQSRQWIALQTDTVMGRQVTSPTNHFADMISGIIKIPESPQTQGYTPTSIKDMKAADPSVGIQWINAPVASNTGAAMLSLPLMLPKGRQQMQPSLVVQYNSDGDNGWMGLGWNMTVPFIGIETRWGVPRYDNSLETETYTLRGEQLAPMARLESLEGRTPEKVFRLRVEGSFQLIVRHGNSPSNYWWEVTEKNGIQHFYGGLPSVGVVPACVLKDDNGNIAHWALLETRDANNNNVRYAYETVINPNVANGQNGRQIYLRRIAYTGNGSADGLYSVHFIRDSHLSEALRKDIDINARLGFKQVISDRLRQVEIRIGSQLIRSYDFSYGDGAFSKTLLKSISEKDGTGTVFFTQSLDYFNEVQSGTNFQPLESSKPWNVPFDDIKGDIKNPLSAFSGESTVLNSAKSKTSSNSLSITFGLYDGNLSKSNTLGGSFGSSRSTTEGLATLLDINGDGLPDKVFKKNGQLLYRPNLGIAQRQFGGSRPINGIGQFSGSRANTSTRGLEANFFSAFFSRERSNTTTTTTEFLSDFNGDGLIDLATGGKVLFNRLDGNGNPTFLPRSTFTPSPIYSGNGIDRTFLAPDTALQRQQEKEYPLQDVVRMWRAPFNGLVTIQAPVRLLNAGTNNITNKKLDGVRVSIQKSGSVLWSDQIPAGDFLTRNPGALKVPVFQNDRIYFRVQSVYNGDEDVVEWDPLITYDLPVSPAFDANKRSTARYKASEDFVLHRPYSIPLSKGGAVRITGNVDKGLTSDTVRVVILHYTNNTWRRVYQQTFASRTAITWQAWLDSLPVNAGDSLWFKLESDSYVDRNVISWVPHFEYIAFSDGTQVKNLSGQPLIEDWVTPDQSNYNDWLIKTPLLFNGQGDTIRIWPDLTGTAAANGTIYFTVKGKDTLYGKRTLQLVNGTVTVPVDSIQILGVKDTIFCEYYADNRQVANVLNTLGVRRDKDSVYILNAQPRDTIVTTFLKAGLFTEPAENYLGSLFRGWGHFSFKGDPNNGPLDESKITVNNLSGFSSDPNIVTDTAALNNIIDVSATEFVPLHPQLLRNAWVGFDSSVFVSPKTMGSARLWMHDVTVDSVMVGADLSAVNKVSETRTTSYSLGVIAGATYSTTRTVGRLDMMDLNGDRYPDILHQSEVQYTLPNGGLEGTKRPNSVGMSVFDGSSKGFSLGGSLPVAVAKNVVPINAPNASENADASIGFSPSGNLATNDDEVISNWLDINGDGLPDKILDGGNVRLNLGYKFGAPENWGLPVRMEKNHTDQQSAGAGLGFSSWFGSFQGGFSLLRTKGSAGYSLEDINGDGLPDLVWAGTPFTVQLNNGNGFSAPLLWNGASTVRQNSSVGESGNFAFTIGIPIYIPFLPPFKLCFNPSFSSGNGVSRENDQWGDIDGDGYADVIHSQNDGNLSVERSRIGKTNLLQSVLRPMKGAFSIDYVRVGNTYDQPQSKWVLDKVEITDGIRGDGADTIRNSFAYSGGYYDRHEREFYGFRTVTTNQLNTLAANTIYRSQMQQFLNRDFYRKGLLDREWTQDAAGNRYTETTCRYSLRNVQDSSFFPALIEKQELFYEGAPTVGASRTVQMNYDNLGNLTNINDGGDGTPNDLISAVITYQNPPNRYIKDIPASIAVTTIDGLKRRRETSVDADGNITQIRQYLQDGSIAVYDMTYDQFGNLRRITRPANHKGQRMWYQYTYDNQASTFVTRVEDAFGYNSYSTYDLRFGEVTETVSMNNERIRYGYDNRGRLITVTGPYEIAAGRPYTIAFDYHPDAVVPYAITHHYDPEHNGNINTITFADGLGRAIQVKKQVSLFTGKGLPDEISYVVSGKQLFDAFGRVEENRYPVTEPIGANNNTLNTKNGLLQSQTAYDVLDRVKTTRLADGATTSLTYRISGGLLSTITRDPLQNQTEVFTDVKGRKRTELALSGPSGTITTTFGYNALDELIRVTDVDGNVTTHTYDNLGRKLSQNHPDAGLTEFQYDLAGNLVKKITPQIRKEIPNGGAIQYLYDFERLTDIDYPRQFQNKVKYVYGKPGTGSKAGRLILQEDASGGHEFFYGPLGEITKTIRTVMVNSVFYTTYVSQQEYDTWNRLKKMVYPDGEVVTYHYNQGGSLHSIEGSKLGHAYNYVNQLGYNEFEQRVYLQYGNGTETTYDYDSLRRRLATLQALTVTGRLMMDNRYTYDAVNNILGIVNNAQPVAGKLGGFAKQDYQYDKLYRLTHASGRYQGDGTTANYSLSLTYDNLYNIVRKQMSRSQTFGSYDLTYTYSPTAPHQVTKLGDISRQYDLNGNLISYTGRRNYWDEENRLMAVINGGVLSRYTYDAGGERVIKSSGGLQGTWVNGAPAGLINHDSNYTVYVSPYLVCRKSSFTKHIYIEGQRIATKIGIGRFTNISFPQAAITAGGVNYLQRMANIQKQRQDYYAGMGISPGPPTDKYFYAQPYNSGIAAPVIVDNSANTIPPGWPGNTTPPPTGPPIFVSPIPSNDSVKAGYGFVATGQFYEQNQYFYHPDHLGSTGYVTNTVGEVSQHQEYTPYGETFFDEHINTFQTPYLFTGKEKDEENGMYYYGARYYDPRTSLWVSVDPLVEKYPSLSPYNYCVGNPVRLVDPDGNSPTLITGVVGFAVGGLVGGVGEAGRQLYSEHKISNVNAIGGSALQGAITGGAAGLTGGASLLTTAAVSGSANAVGGIANRAIQGHQTSASDVVLDATIGAGVGAGGKLVGHLVEGAVDKLSNAAKGTLGETITKIKYATKGYRSLGKAEVPTGEFTAVTGRVQKAEYDHLMENVFTGKQLTLESKFNSGRLTPNQRAAIGNIKTPGGLIIDKTSSRGISNMSQGMSSGMGAGGAAQRNRE